CWSDATPGSKRLARGQAMVDPQTSAKRDDVTLTLALEYEQVAANNVEHPDAVVSNEVLWTRRSSVRDEVLRCCHKQPPRLAHQPEFHRAVREWAQAQRDIDAFTTQIDALVGEAEIDGYVGIAFLEGEDQPAYVHDAERSGAGDSNSASRRATSAPHLLARLIDHPQDLPTTRVLAAALFRRSHARCRSAQERHAESFLEFAQLTSHGRLANPQHPCDGR